VITPRAHSATTSRAPRTVRRARSRSARAGHGVLVSSRAALELTGDRSARGRAAHHRGAVAPAGWVLPDGAPLPSEIWLRDPEAAHDASSWVLELRGSLHRTPMGSGRGQSGARAPGHRRRSGPRDDDLAGIGAHRTMGSVSLGGGRGDRARVLRRHAAGAGAARGGSPGRGTRQAHGPALSSGEGTDDPRRGTSVQSRWADTCIVRGEVADSVFARFHQQGTRRLHRPRAPRSLGQPRSLHYELRPEKQLPARERLDARRTSVTPHLLKVGCFLGDHVKTGIGTVLNTGTVIGAGSNCYGGVMPPTVVPPFSWGSGSDLRDHQCDKFLDTAERAMVRREQELTPGVRRILAGGVARHCRPAGRGSIAESSEGRRPRQRQRRQLDARVRGRIRACSWMPASARAPSPSGSATRSRPRTGSTAIVSRTTTATIPAAWASSRGAMPRRCTCRAPRVTACADLLTGERGRHRVHRGKAVQRSGVLSVEPFLTVHDAADPVGVAVVDEETRGLRVGIATDLGRPTAQIRHALASCDLLVLEANHDEVLLHTGPYPASVKRRIASSHGHLSNQAAARLATELLHPRLAAVVLAHLSFECNQADSGRARGGRRAAREGLAGPPRGRAARSADPHARRRGAQAPRRARVSSALAGP
jgi:hypothetical protein